ncbi:MAG: TonB-dependent receptor plug domain-containing protein [Woeseiaceae bacterium]
MRRLPPFLAALATVVVWHPCVAADEQSNVDLIVVTASRLQRTASELTQSVTVFDRAEIQARQYASVTELLRQVAGINVVQQGARGGVSSVVVRGGESNFTVVLIDGIKVNDPTNTRGGSYDFSYLDIASVERVEIIRGPMSAIYGSDALAGVINIITRSRTEGAQIQGEVGGHGLRAGRLALGGGNDEVTGSIAVRALREEGDIEGADYEDWGMEGSLNLNLGASGEAGLQFRHSDATSTSFPEDSGGPLFAVLRDVDRRSVEESHARLYLHQAIGAVWKSRIAVSRYERNEDASSPGIAPGVFDGVPPNAADTTFTRDQLSIALSRELGNMTKIVLGTDWQNEDGNSAGFLDFGFPLPTNFELSRETLSAFAEIEYTIEALQLQASLRWDDPEDVSDEISVGVGALYSLPGDNGAIRINWGEAFKTPSFFALGHPLVGNPNLVPETATSFDVGYRRSISNSGSLELSIYRSEFEDLIDFDPMLFTNVNRSRVVSEGVEFTAQWAVTSSVDVDLHASYSDTDIRDSDARLRSRPHWRGGVSVDWRIDDHWLFAASFLSLGEFWESSIPTGGLTLDGYQRLDIALSYDTNERVRIGLAIDNALDEDYYEAVGFPAAGIRGRVNAAYRF